MHRGLVLRFAVLPYYWELARNQNVLIPIQSASPPTPASRVRSNSSVEAAPTWQITRARGVLVRPARMLQASSTLALVCLLASTWGAAGAQLAAGGGQWAFYSAPLPVLQASVGDTVVFSFSGGHDVVGT